MMEIYKENEITFPLCTIIYSCRCMIRLGPKRRSYPSVDRPTVRIGSVNKRENLTLRRRPVINRPVIRRPSVGSFVFLGVIRLLNPA